MNFKKYHRNDLYEKPCILIDLSESFHELQKGNIDLDIYTVDTKISKHDFSSNSENIYFCLYMARQPFFSQYIIDNNINELYMLTGRIKELIKSSLEKIEVKLDDIKLCLILNICDDTEYNPVISNYIRDFNIKIIKTDIISIMNSFYRSSNTQCWTGPIHNKSMFLADDLEKHAHAKFVSNFLNDQGYFDKEALFSNTDFSVVCETISLPSLKDVTYLDTLGMTISMFSENTYKAIYNSHPFILFGGKNSHKQLRDLGFISFEEYYGIDCTYIEELDKSSVTGFIYKTLLYKKLNNLYTTFNNNIKKHRDKIRKITAHNYKQLEKISNFSLAQFEHFTLPNGNKFLPPNQIINSEVI